MIAPITSAQPGCDVRHHGVIEGPAQYWDAELGCGAVGFDNLARRNRDTAHVEEIAEIGVRADPGVDRDGVGRHLRERRLQP